MEDYKVKDTDIVGEIKNLFRGFITNSKSLSKEQKRDLIEELGDNWYDDRFNAEAFIKDAVDYSVHVWSAHNFDIAELWKQVAVNSSKISESPQDVANKTVKCFEDNYINNNE